jgi:hypothetical protein
MHQGDVEMESQNKQGRREFVKKAMYVAPVIVTLAVAPSYAKAGSLKSSKQPKAAPKPPKRP